MGRKVRTLEFARPSRTVVFTIMLYSNGTSAENWMQTAMLDISTKILSFKRMNVNARTPITNGAFLF